MVNMLDLINLTPCVRVRDPLEEMVQSHLVACMQLFSVGECGVTK